MNICWALQAHAVQQDLCVVYRSQQQGEVFFIMTAAVGKKDLLD